MITTVPPLMAIKIYDELNAPPQLVAHLKLVHDVAVQIVNGLRQVIEIDINEERVLLGASIHDLGKVLHPSEIYGPGNMHEEDGPSLLERHGVPKDVARFAGTHGKKAMEAGLEDMIVALADASWKGHRRDDLEKAICSKMATKNDIEEWEAFVILDEILSKITEQGDERIAWQASYDQTRSSRSSFI